MSVKQYGLFAKTPNNMPVDDAGSKLEAGLNSLSGHVNTMLNNRGGDSNKKAADLLRECRESIASINQEKPLIESSEPKMS